MNKWKKTIYSSDPTCGGRNYILKWVFLFIYIHRREMWVVSLKSSYSAEFEISKIFLKFVFFEELSRFKFSCEHGIFGSLLYISIVIFVRNNIFSMKNLIQNYLLRKKMHQFDVLNRREAIKKTCSGLIEKFTIKKLEIRLRAVFLEKFLLFCFLSH